MPLRYSEQQEKVTSLMILSKADFNQEPGPIYFQEAFSYREADKRCGSQNWNLK